MDTEEEDNSVLDRMVRDASGAIGPVDSWEALRKRIDSRLENETRAACEEGFRAARDVVFWRRIALVMAACFVVTAGSLVYMLGFNSGAHAYRERSGEVRAGNDPLSQSDITRLGDAFSQVRQLFEQQASWIVVASNNAAEIGVDDAVNYSGRSDVIVARLACNYSGAGVSERQYFDVVAIANKKAHFQLPTPGGLVVVSVLPKLKADGSLALEVEAESSTGSRAESVGPVVKDAFTSLVYVRTNGGWLSIDGTGETMSKM